MADTYSKLLGLSGDTALADAGKSNHEHGPALETKKRSLLANQQTSKPTKKQTSLPTNQQTSKEVSQQTNKPVNSQTSNQTLTTKEKKKYGTYLREGSILEIQIHAAQTQRKDHEVLQDAVDFYMKHHKR